MCGRFSHALSWSDVVQLYGLTQPEPPPRWLDRCNVAPSQLAPVVRLNPDTGVPVLVMLQWGLVPFWAREAELGYSTINAQTETIATSPAFSEAFQRRRCLVPASSFYEWRAEGDHPKQPYRIRRAHGGPMTFAGLWERWMPPKAAALETFAIIVGPANDQVRPVHDRMPVILEPEQWASWLYPNTGLSTLHRLLNPYDGALTVRPVLHATSKTRIDRTDPPIAVALQ